MVQTTNELHSGHATVSTFDGHSLVGQQRVYCAGTPPNASCYYPNVAWFCPACGEVWRRQVYTFEFPYRPLVAGAWRAYTARCPSCAPPLSEIDQLLKEI